MSESENPQRGGPIQIQLQGKMGGAVILDRDDKKWVEFYRWYGFEPKGDEGMTYARANVPTPLQRPGLPKTVYLHRIVMNAPKESKVNHEDEDGLNCRRSNLTVLPGLGGQGLEWGVEDGEWFWTVDPEIDGPGLHAAHGSDPLELEAMFERDRAIVEIVGWERIVGDQSYAGAPRLVPGMSQGGGTWRLSNSLEALAGILGLDL